MARIRIGQDIAASTVQQTIIDRIKAGKVIPIISKMSANDLVLGIGQYKEMIKAYAEHVRYYPYSAARELRLSQVAQYISVVREQVADREAAKELYLKFVKSWVFSLAEAEGLPPHILEEYDEQFDFLSCSQLAYGLGYPNFDQSQTIPLLVLASLPLPIYLTTSQHYFIEIALKRAGKDPRTALCSWREGLESRPFTFDQDNMFVFMDNYYQPSASQPLVYHLHGFDAYPASLVLTEDDHLEFLVAISRDKGRNTDPIPPLVREALAESSLLLLGYDLHSWDFRVLFWGLIKVDFKRRYKSVSVQLEPEQIDEKYLQSYLSEANFEVYRGNIYQYVQELRQDLEG